MSVDCTQSCVAGFVNNEFFSVVPHITDAIQEWVMKQAKVPVDDDELEPQVCVIEVSLDLNSSSLEMSSRYFVLE